MRLSVASLTAAELEMLARIRPAEERPLDCARFVLGGLIALEFNRHEVTRLAGGFGWTGYLRERGFDPGRAFDRHYRDGSMVVAFIPDLPRKGPLS
jgi:hypothetical protein